MPKHPRIPVLPQSGALLLVLLSLPCVATAQVTPQGGLTVGKNTYLIGQPAQKALDTFRQSPTITKTYGTVTAGKVGPEFSYIGAELKPGLLDNAQLFFENGKVVTLTGTKTHKTKGAEANHHIAQQMLRTLGPPAYLTVTDTLTSTPPTLAWKKQGTAIFLSLTLRKNKGQAEAYQEIKIAPDTPDVLTKLYGTPSVTPQQAKPIVAPLRALVEKQFPGRGKSIPLKLNLPSSQAKNAAH